MGGSTDDDDDIVKRGGSILQEDCEDTFCSCWLCVNCRKILCNAIIHTYASTHLVQGWLKEDKNIKLFKTVQNRLAHDMISERIISMTVISSCIFEFAKGRCSK
jgi:hypothetical protein